MEIGGEYYAFDASRTDNMAVANILSALMSWPSSARFWITSPQSGKETSPGDMDEEIDYQWTEVISVAVLIACEGVDSGISSL